MTSRLSRVAGLLVLEGSAVVVLHLLGTREFLHVDWSNLSDWLDRTPVEDVIAAGLQLVALGIAYWLLLSTLAYLVASLSRRAAAIKATSWLTLPPIRGLVSRSVALSIAASSIVVPLSPAVADLTLGSRASGAVVEVDPDGVIHPPGTEQQSEDGNEGSPEDEVMLPPHLQAPVDRPVDNEPVVASETGQTLDPAPFHVHKVVGGDHLWSIACRHLEGVTGRTNLGEHEIAPYWVRVIEANQSTIRSGDPDLIYPGEQIVLPPVPSQGAVPTD